MATSNPDDGNTIAKYIDRFRSEKPSDRKERQRSNHDEFWWQKQPHDRTNTQIRHHYEDDDNSLNDDVSSLTGGGGSNSYLAPSILQPKISSSPKIKRKTASKLDSNSLTEDDEANHRVPNLAATSMEKKAEKILGAIDLLYPLEKSDNVTSDQHGDSTLSTLPDDVTFQDDPNEDILAQWRLLRRMQVAKEKGATLSTAHRSALEHCSSSAFHDHQEAASSQVNVIPPLPEATFRRATHSQQTSVDIVAYQEQLQALQQRLALLEATQLFPPSQNLPPQPVQSTHTKMEMAVQTSPPPPLAESQETRRNATRKTVSAIHESSDGFTDVSSTETIPEVQQWSQQTPKGDLRRPHNLTTTHRRSKQQSHQSPVTSKRQVATSRKHREEDHRHRPQPHILSASYSQDGIDSLFTSREFALTDEITPRASVATRQRLLAPQHHRRDSDAEESRSSRVSVTRVIREVLEEHVTAPSSRPQPHKHEREKWKIHQHSTPPKKLTFPQESSSLSYLQRDISKCPQMMEIMEDMSDGEFPEDEMLQELRRRRDRCKALIRSLNEMEISTGSM